MKKSLKTTALYHPLTDISAHNIVLIVPDPLQLWTEKIVGIIQPIISEVSSSKVLSRFHSELGGSYRVMVRRLKLEKPEINQPLDLTAELFQEYAVTFQWL